MAAYAATVTKDLTHAMRVGQVGILTGVVDVTNYNSTHAEITGITGAFKSLTTVILDGLSDNGYNVHWVPATGSVKAYASVTTKAASEVADDTDVGAVNFVAIGYV